MFCLLVAFAMINGLVVAGSRVHTVYWNTTNPVFRIDNTDNIIDVNAGNAATEYDQMHLICPNSGEHHVIYSVSREEFMSCRVSSPRPKIVAVCNKPAGFRYFTITFRAFSPTPGGLEFKPGQTYYLISTSTRRGLHRRAGGYCSTHNMKMVLNIAESPATAAAAAVDSDIVRPVRINVPRVQPTTRPKAWNTRVPAHRSDLIYYYKPWNSPARSNRFLKFEPLVSNSIVQALPLTSASATAVSAAAANAAVAVACLVTMLSSVLVR